MDAAVAHAAHGVSRFVLLVIAAALAGFAFYRLGEVRAMWPRWRAAVGSMRARRLETLRTAGITVFVVAAAVLILIFAVRGG